MLDKLEMLKNAFADAYGFEAKRVETLFADGVVIFRCDKKQRKVKIYPDGLCDI